MGLHRGVAGPAVSGSEVFGGFAQSLPGPEQTQSTRYFCTIDKPRGYYDPAVLSRKGKTELWE